MLSWQTLSSIKDGVVSKATDAAALVQARYEQNQEGEGEGSSEYYDEEEETEESKNNQAE